MTKLSKHEASPQSFFKRSFSGIAGLIKKFRQKYLIFLFFVIISTISWLFITLGDTYVADLKYPVKYTNPPQNKILSESPPGKFLLTVRAEGYTIITTRLKRKRPLEIDIRDFLLYSLSEDSTSLYTLTRYNKDKLSTQLNQKDKNLQIVDIKPDTLLFNFTKVRRKKLGIEVVIVNHDELFMRQHMFNGEPVVSPDSIIITGPSSIVDTLKKVYTSPVNLSNLSDTVEEVVELEAINRTSLTIKKVKVIIPVDEFTEAEVDVPLKQKNVPDSLILRTFPNSIRVKYQVTLSKFDDVEASLFKAYIDFNSITLGETSRMKIFIDSIPDYLNNVRLSHRYVEYLIERNSVETRSDRRNR